MPSFSTFMINYPSSVSIQQSNISICTTSWNQTNYYPMWCLVNQTTQTIRMLNGLYVPIPAGQLVTLSLGYFILNSTIQTNGSFNITSYADNNFTDSIDTILGGLIPKISACNYPCASCLSSTDRSTCLTCFNVQAVPERYLNGSSCLVGCPFGFYSDQYLVCHSCDPVHCPTSPPDSGQAQWITSTMQIIIPVVVTAVTIVAYLVTNICPISI